MFSAKGPENVRLALLVDKFLGNYRLQFFLPCQKKGKRKVIKTHIVCLSFGNHFSKLTFFISNTRGQEE